MPDRVVAEPDRVACNPIASRVRPLASWGESRSTHALITAGSNTSRIHRGIECALGSQQLTTIKESIMNTKDTFLSISLDRLDAVSGGAGANTQPTPQELEAGKPILDPHGTGKLIDTILVPLPGGGFATMPKPDDAFTRANPPVGAPRF